MGRDTVILTTNQRENRRSDDTREADDAGCEFRTQVEAAKGFSVRGFQRLRGHQGRNFPTPAVISCHT